LRRERARPLRGAEPGARSALGAQVTEDRVRLDKWLWAARFYKTRGLAADEAGHGRISVNGQVAKASRELKPGDLLVLRQGPVQRTVQVLALSHSRGPAPVAQALYAETPESVAERLKAAEARRLGAEPAGAIEQGRPTKRDRRKLADWQRWSASADEE
jgi:ribosome-associated heat shock protein Hsp15